MKNCFKDTKVLVFDSFTNAVIAMRDGRADAVMWDDTASLGIAVTDPQLEARGATCSSRCPYGIGIKQGKRQLKAWVDSRLELMKKRDLFLPILKGTCPRAGGRRSRRTSCGRSRRSRTTLSAISRRCARRGHELVLRGSGRLQRGRSWCRPRC